MRHGALHMRIFLILKTKFIFCLRISYMHIMHFDWLHPLCLPLQFLLCPSLHRSFPPWWALYLNPLVCRFVRVLISCSMGRHSVCHHPSAFSGSSACVWASGASFLRMLWFLLDWSQAGLMHTAIVSVSLCVQGTHPAVFFCRYLLPPTLTNFLCPQPCFHSDP